MDTSLVIKAVYNMEIPSLMATRNNPCLPRVSAIIRVYNDAAGLLRYLAGLESQSYPADRIEVIVVDNGSNPPIKVATTQRFALRVQHCAKPGSYAVRKMGVAPAVRAAALDAARPQFGGAPERH